jgi:hypothetical protein
MVSLRPGFFAFQPVPAKNCVLSLKKGVNTCNVYYIGHQQHRARREVDGSTRSVHTYASCARCTHVPRSASKFEAAHTKLLLLFAMSLATKSTTVVAATVARGWLFATLLDRHITLTMPQSSLAETEPNSEQ